MSNIDPATAKQPTPKGSGPDIADLVCKDIMARKAEGTAKYGEPLRPFNGRSAMVDAYQEALDMAQYLRQAIEEMEAAMRDSPVEPEAPVPAPLDLEAIRESFIENDNIDARVVALIAEIRSLRAQGETQDARPSAPADPQRINQTVTGPRGNCYSACLAMMLGLPISEVPNFCDTPGLEEDPGPIFQAAAKAWLAARGWGHITVAAHGPFFKRWFSKGFVMAAGMTSRGFLHSVIYKDGELWHDPHPSHDGLTAVGEVDLLYPLKPFAAAPEEPKEARPARPMKLRAQVIDDRIEVRGENGEIVCADRDMSDYKAYAEEIAYRINHFEGEARPATKKEKAQAAGCTIYRYDKDIPERCYFMLAYPDGEYSHIERKTEAEAWEDFEGPGETGEGREP
jgi:hypothetical protein